MVPFDGGWAASWALWGDGKYHHDHTARQKKGREGEGVEVPTLILQMTLFFLSVLITAFHLRDLAYG